MNAEKAILNAIVKLLEIKTIDIRIVTLEQAREAVDNGIHSGGALSAIIPLVALYYGDIMHIDVEHPTLPGQDLFVLSKGHAVAPLASIYADLGYFEPEILKNSRSYESILNGHPGPILPGIHTSTGPLGQGICVAGGFAMAGRIEKRFDVFCMTGDGEMQEGTAWEAVMHAGARGADNFCVIVDNNFGQLDNTKRLLLPSEKMAEQFRAFGWNAVEADGTSCSSLLHALSRFKYGERNGKPTVIISKTTKGYGGFAEGTVKHKTTMSDEEVAWEIEQNTRVREIRCEEYASIMNNPLFHETGIPEVIHQTASRMNYSIDDVAAGIPPSGRPAVENRASADKAAAENRAGTIALTTKSHGKKCRPAPKRNKKIASDSLPVLDPAKEYTSDQIVTAAMKQFARDRRVVTLDADLASTSGLEKGVSAVDKNRSFNVGVAEANMMCMGEAFAALGYNAWVSTFCPFFNWNVLRRIAIGYQERMEAVANPRGWLSEGHGLDLTFLATAPNFETKTNGATHMGNDDILVYGEIAHLKIIDASCPHQLLAIIEWIMEGNKGLVYLRIMRGASPVLYKSKPKFEYGASYKLKSNPRADVVLFSSGRGVHEILKASDLLEEQGIKTEVIDMPSVDEEALLACCDSKKTVVFAEQNNGFLFSAFRKIVFKRGKEIDVKRFLFINTLGPDQEPRFIHSGTYEELIDHCGLSAEAIAKTAIAQLEKR